MFKSCNSRQCGLCCVFKSDSSFKSTTTNRTYKAIVPKDVDIVDCNTVNCVYLITCSVCNLQYVGETAQRLKDRCKTHRKGINSPQKKTTRAIYFMGISTQYCVRKLGILFR